MNDGNKLRRLKTENGGCLGDFEGFKCKKGHKWENKIKTLWKTDFNPWTSLIWCICDVWNVGMEFGWLEQILSMLGVVLQLLKL